MGSQNLTQGGIWNPLGGSDGSATPDPPKGGSPLRVPCVWGFGGRNQTPPGLAGMGLNPQTIIRTIDR